MPWVRFDDNTSEDPRIDHLSDGAFRLWFNAITYSARNLTDGFVPTSRVPRLTPHYKAAHLNQLVEAGLFHKELDGIRVHKYLDYQPSARQVAEQREYERQKKQRQRNSGANAVDHDSTTGRFMSRGDNKGDTCGDSLRESGGESPATHPIPSLVVKSPSDLRVALGRGSETEDAKATAIAIRLHGLIASNARKPPTPTAVGSFVLHVASHLDLASFDEAVGYLDTLTSKPGSLSYAAKALRTWASQRGVDLPEWRSA